MQASAHLSLQLSAAGPLAPLGVRQSELASQSSWPSQNPRQLWLAGILPC
ncbi:hypothetical protein EV186_102544 [Labedaea rhizosphaerae]|uniref:Uncharacterized protein n=1 Tax=Labedaea rhizosphaerae TaxID=598644 RepID=A0A4R6SFB5_LABRH|nr:hypothetical protein EV186_102544 [Labedaea rhizosphaerae]